MQAFKAERKEIELESVAIREIIAESKQLSDQSKILLSQLQEIIDTYPAERTKILQNYADRQLSQNEKDARDAALKVFFEEYRDETTRLPRDRGACARGFRPFF